MKLRDTHKLLTMQVASAHRYRSSYRFVVSERNTDSILLLPAHRAFHFSGVQTEFGGKPISITRVVVVGVAVVVHITEVSGVAPIRRALPPIRVAVRNLYQDVMSLYLCLSDFITPVKSFMASSPSFEICSSSLFVMKFDLHTE